MELVLQLYPVYNTINIEKDVEVAAAEPSQFHERIRDVEVASISEKIPCGSNLESLQEQETHWQGSQRKDDYQEHRCHSNAGACMPWIVGEEEILHPAPSTQAPHWVVWGISPITNQLFGDNLTGTIKEIKELYRLSTSRASNYNPRNQDSRNYNYKLWQRHHNSKDRQPFLGQQQNSARYHDLALCTEEVHENITSEVR